jgi:hypothetical protein
MVSFGYEGLSTIIEAKKKNPEDLRQGLEDIIGKSRSLDRVEKIFVVKNGVGIPIE